MEELSHGMKETPLLTRCSSGTGRGRQLDEGGREAGDFISSHHMAPPPTSAGVSALTSMTLPRAVLLVSSTPVNTWTLGAKLRAATMD